MKITQLNIVDGKKIEWLLDENQVSLNLPNIIQVEIDDEKESIFILSGEANHIPLELRVVTVDGQGINLCAVPEGFSFSYLTHHPSLGVAVVASANEKIHGWYDWHFGYDKEKSELYRFCPAY